MTDPCEILAQTRRIAVLGMSPSPHRTSHQIAAYLDAAGFETLYVNPNYPVIGGRPCHTRLAAIEGPVDIVDVFRAAEHESDVADDVLAMPQLPRAVWFQLNAGGQGAQERLRAAGIEVFVNSCIRVVHSMCGAKQDEK